MSFSLCELNRVVLNCYFRPLWRPIASAVSNKSSQIYPPIFSCQTRSYAAAETAKKSKLSSTATKMKDFPVEKDPHKLVTYCCGINYFQTGEDVKLKPDSEYPDWLYTLDIGKSKRLDELEPNSKEWWLKVRLLARKRINKIHRLRTKVFKVFK